MPDKLIVNIAYRGEWRVSPGNPFVQEFVNASGKVVERRPHWALILPVAAVLLAAVITVSVILYRRWRAQNCYPIYFAGKVRYGRKGRPIGEALQYSQYGSGCWLTDMLQFYSSKSAEFYTDAALTKPLNRSAPLSGPLYIFPKNEN